MRINLQTLMMSTLFFSAAIIVFFFSLPQMLVEEMPKGTEALLGLSWAYCTVVFIFSFIYFMNHWENGYITIAPSFIKKRQKRDAMDKIKAGLSEQLHSAIIEVNEDRREKKLKRLDEFYEQVEKFETFNKRI